MNGVKNKIFLKRSSLPAVDRLPGERNGKTYRKKLNIVQKNAGIRKETVNLNFAVR